MKNILIILSLALLMSCKSDAPKETSTGIESNVVTLSADQTKNAGLSLGRVEQTDIANTLSLNGKIEVPPQNMISISVPMGGYLKMTKLLPGMKVKKGEVIAVIEDQQYIQLQQDYVTTKARLNFVEKENERQKELNQSKASSDKVYQQAQADYISMKVQLKAFSEKLKLIGVDPDQINENHISRSINLRSPIDGFVTTVNFNVGKYINPTDVLFELVNQSDIHLTLLVFEKDLEKIYVGQKLQAYTNTEPDKKYLGEIILIGKAFAMDRSVQVHCHFSNYDLSLIPGMFMNADIELKTKKAAVLPSESIITFEGKNYIFLKKNNNQYEMTEVKTGYSEKGYSEIISNQITDQDSIVIKGAYNLLMTMKNKAE